MKDLATSPTAMESKDDRINLRTFMRTIDFYERYNGTGPSRLAGESYTFGQEGDKVCWTTGDPTLGNVLTHEISGNAGDVLRNLANGINKLNPQIGAQAMGDPRIDVWRRQIDGWGTIFINNLDAFRETFPNNAIYPNPMEVNPHDILREAKEEYGIDPNTEVDGLTVDRKGKVHVTPEFTAKMQGKQV